MLTKQEFDNLFEGILGGFENHRLITGLENDPFMNPLKRFNKAVWTFITF